MGWEMRGNYGPYYTRSRRVNGRVVRDYIGHGLNGKMAEIFDARDRDRRLSEAAEAAEHKAELDQFQSLYDDTEALCAMIDVMVKVNLESAGYHQHKRGEWRLKREKERNSEADLDR